MRLKKDPHQRSKDKADRIMAECKTHKNVFQRWIYDKAGSAAPEPVTVVKQEVEITESNDAAKYEPPHGILLACTNRRSPVIQPLALEQQRMVDAVTTHTVREELRQLVQADPLDSNTDKIVVDRKSKIRSPQ